MKYICCFSGGKDSTAMLIHLLKNDLPLDEVLYVDVGDWMWESAKDHIKKVEELFNIKITVLDVSDKINIGFQRWGFPSFLNRWCTGIKRDTMRDYLREKWGGENITQYIGYCSDEEQRTGKKLYNSYDVSYPLVDAGITTEMALKICTDYGFDFGGVYDHHSHFNCWLCPLQKKSELYEVFKREPNLWANLHSMQWETDGYYYPNQTVFDIEKQFWFKIQDELKQKRMDARKKYATKRGVYKK